MKRLLSMFLAGVLSAAAWAGDGFVSMIPAKTQGGICFYPQKFFASKFGKMASEKMRADSNALKELQKLESETGINLERDIQRVILNFSDAQKHNWYAVAEGKCDPQGVEKMMAAKKFEEYNAADRNGYRTLTWKDKGQTGYLSFLSADKAVLAMNLADLDAGVAVASGKAPNAAKSPLFAAMLPTEGIPYAEGAFDVQALSKGAGAEQTKNINFATVNLSQLADEKLCLTIKLVMTSAQAAGELKQMAEGAQMMFSTKVPVLKAVKIATQESNLLLRLALNEQELRDLQTMMEQAANAALQEAKAAKAANGQVAPATGKAPAAK